MRAEAPVWRHFTQGALDAAYNNTAACPHAAETLARLASLSVETRKRFCTHRDLAYGFGARQRLDLLACGRPDAPVFAFIHGGYWQRNHKDMFTAMAEGPLALGFDAAWIGYTLAPEASLTAIISECAAALRRIQATLGPRPLLVSGWSAGGHLAARLLEMPEVDAAMPISGVFDLEPVRLSDINVKLRLTEAEARRESPMLRLAAAGKPMLVTFGEQELPELQRQSRDYAEARQRAGLPTRLAPLAGHDHFTLLEAFGAPDGALTRLLAEARGFLGL